MTVPRPFRLIDAMILLLIVALAGGARGWYLSECAMGGSNSGPVRVQDASPLDQRETLVRNLKEQGFFSGLAPLSDEQEPTAHVAPGYPWLLAQATRFSDPDVLVRWVQVALGALTAGLYFLFARRGFGSTLVATLAGLFCALHPFWIIGAAELEEGVVTAFLLALAIWLGARAGQSGGPLTSLLYGLSLAGLALVRAALLPFAFVAVLWLLRRSQTLPRGWLCALLALVAFAGALAPWTVRNYQLNEDLVPIADTACWHVWIGNNPAATGGPMDEYEALQSLAEVRERGPEELRKALGVIPETERYYELVPDALDEMARNPTGTIKRRLSAGLSFLLGEQWLRDRKVWQNGDPAGQLPQWLADSLPPVLLGTLFGMLLLAFGGLRWSYAWRLPSAPAALALVWLPLPYILGHADALSGPRLPLDGILLSYAACALVGLLPGVGPRLRAGMNADARVGSHDHHEPKAA
jgi:4-amino-4-deoxy-L-arabinose transferase-like glycosyltransferase